MQYELAKKLKDAGFPQADPNRALNVGTFQYVGDNSDKETLCYIPTLSELIEACGEQKSLGLERNYGGMWTAYKDTQLWNDVDGYKYQARGTTPEEAVAKLWLALNKK